MCTWCDKFARRDYDNKYFGWRYTRWLRFYGWNWYYGNLGGNKFKFRVKTETRYGTEWKNNKRGGWMRKGNGIFSHW